MTDEPVLRPEEVASVLDGGATAAAVVDSGPRPYSLRDPVPIPPDTEADAKQALARFVEALAEVLRTESGGEVELSLDDLQQQRAETALSVVPPPVWVASLPRSGGGGLALALDSTVALALVDMALGGSGKLPEKGREPTLLESRVFCRFVSAAIDPLSELAGARFAEAQVQVGEVLPTVAPLGEVLGVGLLRVKIGESDHAALLLATASMLVATRKKTRYGVRDPGPLAAPLERVALETRPVLRAGRISLNDLMALEGGKVLRFDAPSDRAFELRVEGKAVGTGRVLRQDGRPVFALDEKLVQPPRGGRSDP